MIFSSPVPFQEAIESRAVRTLLPTDFNSRQLRALVGPMTERAMFSATVRNVEFLQKAEDVITEIVSGKLDEATARLALKDYLDSISYQPDPELRGTIQDLSSDGRLNLIIDTNVGTARGYGQFIQQQDPAALAAFPAQEFLRIEDRDEPRNWPQRWREAARAIGDNGAYRVLDETGRMMAKIDSPIWEALGTLWDDSLGNPYPPFAFRSGMGVADVDYIESVALGVITPEDTVQPQQSRFNDALQATPDIRDAELRRELLRHLPAAKFDAEGVLTLR